MQARGCVRAGVCVCVSEGVTEAPTCPARPSCGRRQAAGEGEAAGARGQEPGRPAGRRTSRPRRLLTQRPLRLPRRVLAALPAGAGWTRGKPAAKQNKTNPALPSLPSLPNPRNREGGHHARPPPSYPAFVSTRITIEVVLPFECSPNDGDRARSSE
uniref:Uncharacterized protein n=1 Tax=Rangifer tarandus platyrhynchus TaxID=3082113 RepID=A0ACB0ETJ7_RANTA|nr:unnamed protein product [Rangifer tarandus platyrhynchus]